MTKIHTIKSKVANCFLLESETGFVLIDTGLSRKAGKFFAYLRQANIDPGDIQLIVITHAHQDHVGGLKEIKEQTGASVLIHESEAAHLKAGKSPEVHPNAWWVKLFLSLQKEIKITPVIPDIAMAEEYSLGDQGINGKVFHTPGHTPGSISVIVDGKSAFIGDLAMKFPIISGRSFEPIIAQDMTQVHSSWKKIIAQGAEQIYPAHGKPFHVSSCIGQRTDLCPSRVPLLFCR